MNFRDIPQFPRAHYTVNVSWSYLEDWLRNERDIIDLDPPFQRAHVWTSKQQSLFVEYILKGGEGSRVLYWNCPGWPASLAPKSLVLVDGKQRLEAVRGFLRGDVVAFGRRFSEFEGRLRLGGGYDFIFQVAKLESEADVLRWYLAINSGGTPHTKKEIEKVRQMLIGVEKV